MVSLTFIRNVIEVAFFGMSLFMSILYLFCLPKAIHIFQQEGYQIRDYIRWINKNAKQVLMQYFREFIFCLIYFVYMLGTLFIIPFLSLNVAQKEFIVMLQLFFYYVIFYSITTRKIVAWKKERKHAKKKLVYTARVKRLFFFCFIALLLIVMTMQIENVKAPNNEAFLVQYYAVQVLSYSFLILTMPIVLIVGAFLALPTETTIKDFYISSARFKMIRPKYRNLIRIGITGSYGKTSTKFILKTILSEKYKVLATPESYNTTMGNIKVIRKELKPEHEVFISEMGARHRGDIRKICEFVYPQIGLITSIGEQHLETFNTKDNIVKTKAELLHAIPKKNESTIANMYSFMKANYADSKCAIFLPVDHASCSELYEKEKERNKFCYGIQEKKAYVSAKDIKVSAEGSTFTAITSIGEIACTTKLLGELNIQNILGAISISVFLGLSKEEIARGVSKIEPVEHRLQVIKNPNGSIVIDDAFNSNPKGSKMALDVLKQFSGRKIIITPGMVELGQKEIEYNETFGKQMAKVVDIAILVGVKRSIPIEQGLKDGGFDSMNTYVVSSLEEATQKLAELTKPGDVILFENDLPDNYNE